MKQVINKLTEEKRQIDEIVIKQSETIAKKTSSCLLGHCTILMEDFSNKVIRDIKVGDVILDGHLNPVSVMAINSSFLGFRKLFQFNQDGPVFTPEHQFYSNIKSGEVAVVSVKDLLLENPQLEERPGIHSLDDLNSILQYNMKTGKVDLEEFELLPFQDHKPMNPDTEVYFIITAGEDGSYIVDNFVSRHELSDFEKWPMTYATLGFISMSCHLNFSVETYAEDVILAKHVQDLIKQWKLAIFYLQDLNDRHLILETIEESKEDIWDIFAVLSDEKNKALKEIINDKNKMRFAMHLNSYGAKILHEALDNEKVPHNQRIALMKLIIVITENFLAEGFQ